MEGIQLDKNFLKQVFKKEGRKDIFKGLQFSYIDIGYYWLQFFFECKYVVCVMLFLEVVIDGCKIQFDEDLVDSRFVYFLFWLF